MKALAAVVLGSWLVACSGSAPPVGGDVDTGGEVAAEPRDDVTTGADAADDASERDPAASEAEGEAVTPPEVDPDFAGREQSIRFLEALLAANAIEGDQRAEATHRLANLYEQHGRTADAHGTYQQIVDEYPNYARADDARAGLARTASAP